MSLTFENPVIHTKSDPGETNLYKVRCNKRFFAQEQLDIGNVPIEANAAITLKEMTVIEMVSFFETVLPGADVHLFVNSEVFFFNKQIGIYFSFTRSDFNKKIDRHVAVYMIGHQQKVADMYSYLNENFGSEKNISVTWMYQTMEGRLESKDFYMKDNSAFFPEFYPYLDDPDEYIDRFHKSSSNILILIGPPGTGKTSFLKHFLFRTKSDAFTTYDQDVMQKDQLYISFLNSAKQYAILEDADILLKSRHRDDNRVMSKILNASDGLVSTNKKFIFTANLAHENEIDEALMRPGRCYDVKHFRALTHSEAAAIAVKLKKDIPTKDEYSLAEIFNGSNSKPKAKFGF